MFWIPVNIFKLVDIKTYYFVYISDGEAVEGMGPQKLKRFVILNAVVLLKFLIQKHHICIINT